MQEVLAPELIEKEEIKNLSFSADVYVDQSADLRRKINDALLLGNSYHTKVSILFMDDEGVKRVKTTIWASGSKYICLKGGMWLPVDRIIEIELV